MGILLQESMNRQQVENALIEDYCEILALSRIFTEVEVQEIQKNADWLQIVIELISSGSIGIEDLYIIMNYGFVTLKDVFSLADIETDGLESIYGLMESGELSIGGLFGLRTGIDVSDPERLHAF